jgi:hypothetical protein
LFHRKQDIIDNCRKLIKACIDFIE